MTTIEDLAPAYFSLAAEWLSKGDINRWLTSEWRGASVTTVMISLMMRNKRNRVFLIRWNDQPVGLTALADIDRDDATAMVWYVLGESSLGKRGIVSEAVRLMAQKCFAELSLRSLYAWVMQDNIASGRVLQKVGFREVGKIRRAANSRGSVVDRIYFDLIVDECVG